MPSFTKNAIIDSFLKLLKEKPLDKITVKEIVADCGINRNTFYYHFEDITALVEEVLRTEAERVLTGSPDMDSWQEGFIAAAEFALDNKRSVYHIYNSVNREVFERYLNRIAEDVMKRFMAKASAGMRASEEDKLLIVSFYKSALSGMVLDWLSSGMQYDPRALIRRLGAILEGGIELALSNCSR